MNSMDLRGICPLTCDEALRRAAAIAPALEAVVKGSERITFGELSAEVERIRGALVATGVRKGDHVGICLGNGPLWVALFLAIGSAGAVAVPINTRFRAEEMAYALRQSKTSFLFLVDRFLKTDFAEMLRRMCPAVDRELPDEALPDLREVVVVGEDVPPGARSFRSFLAAADGPVQARCDPEDTLLIQYTSGTTAYPKGVMLTHRGMCADGFFSGLRMGLRLGDRFHSARPFFHVAGTSLSILASIQNLATLVTMDRFEPQEALKVMEEERCTHFSGNDTIALMLLGHPDRPERKLSLRGGWLAASPTVVRRVVEELGARECVTGYGLSEASPNVAQSSWWEPLEVRQAALMAPEPGVDVRIVDPETHEPLPTGEKGEILVRGWNVMQGYFGMPTETAAALSDDGWLATGDLGRLDDAGRLEFAGRVKELIRVGGENVAPAEVEDIILRHPRIRQAAVVGVPDQRLVEVPFAFVVLTEGDAVGEDELLGWARANMAGFKVPRHLRVVDGFEEIGMTASSKVQKSQLAAHAVRLLEADD
ncbi:MAG TPA: AMP-binding protein [Solirubrobacterales bacterium]